MQSRRRSVPVSDWKVVSRTLVPGRYRRVLLCSPAGETRQKPPFPKSRIAPKSEGLSNQGQHSQSSEPFLDISAADLQSPMMAYSPIEGVTSLPYNIPLCCTSCTLKRMRKATAHVGRASSQLSPWTCKALTSWPPSDSRLGVRP